MGDTFITAIAIGLAVASVNASFVWYDDGSLERTIGRFVGWLLAFVTTGLIAPVLAEWILIFVF